jgi:hypothetical protein
MALAPVRTLLVSAVQEPHRKHWPRVKATVSMFWASTRHAPGADGGEPGGRGAGWLSAGCDDDVAG